MLRGEGDTDTCADVDACVAFEGIRLGEAMDHLLRKQGRIVAFGQIFDYDGKFVSA